MTPRKPETTCVSGAQCVKVVHVGGGYLHGADDDSAYDVDGCLYCGRCHVALPYERQHPPSKATP